MNYRSNLSAPWLSSLLVNLLCSGPETEQPGSSGRPARPTPSEQGNLSPWLPTLISAFSALCKCKSQRYNTFQRHMGYFRYAAKIIKRVIDVLHHHGFSVSYGSVRNIMRSIAKDARQNMKEWAKLFPPFFVSFDARVRHQRLHNHSELLNYAAGWRG